MPSDPLSIQPPALRGLTGGTDRERLLTSVTQLVEDHPYHAHRHHRSLGVDLASGWIGSQIDDLSGECGILVEAGGDQVVAATTVRPHEFESSVLGVKSRHAGILYTFRDGDRYGLVAHLCRELLRTGGGSGPVLTILRVDGDDIAALAAAQEAGFRVYESASSWMTRPDPSLPPAEVPGCRLEYLDQAGLDAIPDEAIAGLEREVGWAFRHHHFHTDPRLSDRACDRLYEAWVRNTFSEGWSQQAVVTWQGDEVVGFLAFSDDRVHGPDAVTHVLTGSFGMSLRAAPPGVGTAMLRTAVRSARCDVVEMGTQVRNPLMRLFGRERLFPSFSTHYTLHGWSG